MTSLLLRNVELDGAPVDVSIAEGRVGAVGPGLPASSEAEVIDGDGGALLPGLWDHHIHLVALAAGRRSVRVGPPEVRDAAELAATLRSHRPSEPGAWVRAVGYHDSVAGPLDRHVIDRLLPGVPVRVQHRSGAMWVLSSEAIARLDIEGEQARGLERDNRGELTGRVYGGDQWLRERLGAVAPEPPPDLRAVGRELAGYGVVGVTDATPYEATDDLSLLADATSSGALPQHVVAMGAPALTTAGFPGPLKRGPVKLLLADHSLPALDQIVDWVRTAHRHHRPVAVHSTTRASLVLALAALDEAGSIAGDRIEHGSVVPPELHDHLRRHRLTVVTQPGFVAERGDQYLADVEPDDRPHLYPCGSLARHGIAVAGSTDAPFGHPDPWRAIAAATERRTATGRPIGLDEAVGPRRALELFLGSADAPGGAARRIEVGAPADLCLLAPRAAHLVVAPTAEDVRLTVIGGAVAHRG